MLNPKVQSSLLPLDPICSTSGRMLCSPTVSPAFPSQHCPRLDQAPCILAVPALSTVGLGAIWIPHPPA